MSKFYFFTDLDLLESQTVGQAYGPQGVADGKDMYQLTSKHTATTGSNPKAYAVCKGKILVQPDDYNPTLVNIILKPEQHPDNIPPIRYYIYRGILKTSLVNGELVASPTNALTQSINDAVTNPSKDILGLGLYGKTNFQDADKIENAFYIPRDTFELWTVGGGWSIGTFDSANMGFEIMQDVMGFQPTFELVRKNVNQLKVVSLTGSETNAKVFEHWHDKEEILNYLDPAAFYGNFYHKKVYARVSTDDVDDTTLIPEFDKKRGDEIYEAIFGGAEKVTFYNRNKIYLDIRNELNYSMDYFNNYGRTLKVSYIDDDTTPTDDLSYYASGWPLAVLDLPDAGSDETIIKLAFPKGDNSLPLAYVSVGERKIGTIERIKFGKRRFAELEISESQDYTTNFLIITTPNYTEATSPRICSYVKIKYLKRFNNSLFIPKSTGSVLRATKKYDLLFLPLDMNIPFQGDGNLKIKVYDSDSYIDAQQDSGVDYIARTGIAFDSTNNYYILFATLKDKRLKQSFKAFGSTFSITSGAYKTNKDFIEYAINQPTTSKTINIDENTSTLVFKFSDYIEKTFFNSSSNIDFNRELFLMMLTKDEYQLITEAAKTEFSGKYKIYLCAEIVGITDYPNYKLVLKALQEEFDEIYVKSVDVNRDAVTSLNVFTFI